MLATIVTTIITSLILFKFYISGSTCGKRLVTHEALITNGFQTKPGDWPWHAAIYHSNNRDIIYKCGGSLLNTNTVLTAAHCVNENNRQIVPGRIIIHLGKFNLKIYGNTQDFQTHRIISHPNYNPSNLENDIAIILLSTEVKFNNYVQPICLWYSNKVDISEIVGYNGIVVGWGITATDEVSDIIQQAFMPIVTHLQCLRSDREFFASFLSEQNFCAGFKNGTSVCNGDSGGSLSIEKDGVYYIRGIVSLTKARDKQSLCDTKEYVIFTDVAKYTNWIEEVVAELKPQQVKQGDLIFIRKGNVFSAPKCDFFGRDILLEQSRQEDCGEMCFNNLNCTHFAWSTFHNEDGTCYMKQIEGYEIARTNFEYIDRESYKYICGWVVR